MYLSESIPLKLSTYLKTFANNNIDEEEEEEVSAVENTLFAVETNSFEKQRIEKSKQQTTISELQLKQFSKNPYLKIVYALMLEMIK